MRHRASRCKVVKIGLKIRRPQGREGSIPSARTNSIGCSRVGKKRATMVPRRRLGWNHPGVFSSAGPGPLRPSLGPALKALLHTHVCSAQAMPLPSTGPSICTHRFGYEFCRRHLQNCDWQIRQTMSGEFSRRCRENPPTRRASGCKSSAGRQARQSTSRSLADQDSRFRMSR
jgi:hypothetical protein